MMGFLWPEHTRLGLYDWCFVVVRELHGCHGVAAGPSKGSG
jgi:hypothetical protein